MSSPDTKTRILQIAADLFARKGYTGTTIADIARELGTTTAALYYHFPSKQAILNALMAAPLAAYTRLLDGLDASEVKPAELLGALIDITADARDLAVILDRDPAALPLVSAQLPRSSDEMNAETITALAGTAPEPGHPALIRANAALAVVKGATLAALDLNAGTLPPADRAEILAAALRALEG